MDVDYGAECPLQHSSHEPRHGNNLNVHQQMNGLNKVSKEKAEILMDTAEIQKIKI